MSHLVPRRTVLAGSAVGATGLTVLPVLGQASADAADSRVFAHGVASGDPLPRRVLLWTRVTPTRAATPGSGAGPTVRVQWEVARDADFRRVVRRGHVTTGPSRDHTVKVDVGGLEPATWYHYRFSYGGSVSRTGRTRTAPAKRATPDHLRFGVVSCANLQAGWFSAYRHLAARDDLHAVLHLGDYLYEYAPGEYGYGQANEDIRAHEPAKEMVALADYRQRHAQYKTDPDLQDLHAKYPFIVTWDDHEVTNDQWRDGAENHQPDTEGDYLRRRARAHRAYDEWMPVRMSGTADLRDGTRLFRRLRFGALAEISMLDLRTYRDEQTDQTGVSDPQRSITGKKQLEWLRDSLMRRGPQWKLVGNPVMIAPVNFGTLPDELTGPVNDVTGLLPEDGVPYNTDQWDGYTADRNRVLRHLLNHSVEDVVFVTGDIHSGWACELPEDASDYVYENPARVTAGVEFVCSSVTSNNLKDITGDPSGATSTVVEEGIKANNRHIRYLNFDDHGFSVLDLDRERAQMDWFVISERADRDATVRWDASWVTRSGTSRIEPADAPVGGTA